METFSPPKITFSKLTRGPRVADEVRRWSSLIQRHRRTHSVYIKTIDDDPRALCILVPRRHAKHVSDTRSPVAVTWALDPEYTWIDDDKNGAPEGRAFRWQYIRTPTTIAVDPRAHLRAKTRGGP